MDKIVWQLGADASQVRAEMSAAARAGKQGADDIANSFGKVEGGHEKLLRSGHRVSRQISNLSKDLLSGASAGEVFAGSLEGIAKSLNISLGALAALGVGAVVVQKVTEIREEYKKLSEELKRVHDEAEKGGDFKTMAKLAEGAKEAEDAVKKLQERINERGLTGTGGGLLQRFKDLAVSWGTDPMRAAAQGDIDKGALLQARQDKDKFQLAGIDKRRELSDLKASGASSVEIQAAKLGIEFRELNPAVHEQTQAVIELIAKLKDLAQAATEKKAERAGMSLKEIAESTPDVVDNSVSFERFQASQQAKKAMALDAQGEAARQNFDPEGAHAAFNQAGEVKDSITNLKPSEKMSSDFKGALAVTEGELKQIAENTKNQFVNH